MNPLRRILNTYKKPIYQDGGKALVSGGTKEVQNYQKMLNEKYGAGLKEDGAWGPKTQAAYEKFVPAEKSTPSTPSTSKTPTKAVEKTSEKTSEKAPEKTVGKAIWKAPERTTSPVTKPNQTMNPSNVRIPAFGVSLSEASKKLETKKEQPAAKPTQMNASNVRVPGFGMSLPEASRRLEERKQQERTPIRKEQPVAQKTTSPVSKTPVKSNWPSLSDLPKVKTPVKVETKTTKTTAKPAAKLNPANVKIPVFGNPVLDRRQLPQTGVVIDRGTNEAYVFGNKKSYSYPVLTGMSDDPMANKNMYTTKQIEKIGKKAKVTPTGYYIMDKDNVSENDKKHYQGNIRALNPISAYGVPAPKAANTALHQTANPAYRNQFYSQGPEQRRQSYACTNAQGQNICKTFKDVADKDTALIIDSRLPSDKKLLEQARKRRGYKSGGMSIKSKLKQSYINKVK